jgi:hypothetical protein
MAAHVIMAPKMNPKATAPSTGTYSGISIAGLNGLSVTGDI